MKLYMYANFNVLAGFFGPVIQERIEPEEMKKDYIQVICGFDEKSLNGLKECDLYCLGSIDNVTGEIFPCKEFLLHCNEVVNKILRSEIEELENGESC